MEQVRARTAAQKRYYWTMVLEDLRNYLASPLPLELDARQHFGLLRAVFLWVFASTVLIHLLTQEQIRLMDMLVHATIIGLTYGLAVGIASALLYTFRNSAHRIHVWQLWLASMAGFVLGYFFLPLEPLAGQALGSNAGAHSANISFVNLMPVWCLVTYLFIQPYLTEGLRRELVQLREANERLEANDATATPDRQAIRFESGRNEFVLNADAIRNIVVEDHYCYIHYRQQSDPHDRGQDDGPYCKRDLAMPLREVLALLPPEFVQVHRSHIVNMNHIASIRRKNREVQVMLNGGCEVPVSRHRLEEVLPLIGQQSV